MTKTTAAYLNALAMGGSVGWVLSSVSSSLFLHSVFFASMLILVLVAYTLDVYSH